MPFSFLIVAGQIGVQLDVLRPAVYAAPVAASLLSALLFPAAALTLLHSGRNSLETYSRRPAEPAGAPDPTPTLGSSGGTVVSSR